MIRANGQTQSANQSDVSGSSAETLLLAQDLRMSYGPRQALQGLSFSLQAGRVLGFLGPNGAGKTTSIRILTTMLEPTSGYFSVDGISSQYPEKIRRKIGVLPENLGLPKGMTAIEYLMYFGQLYGLSAANARSDSMALLNEVGMQQRAKSLIGSYSHGMRQRLGIARALINEPVVIFLDEPTLGLDPRGQQELLGLIPRIARERRASVVLSSHLLSEIEGICDDVVILSAGQVVASGTVAEVVKGTERNAIRVQVPSASLAETQRILSESVNVKKVVPVTGKAGCLDVYLADSPDADSAHEARARNEILELVLNAGIPVLSFDATSGRLQDVFLQLTSEAIS